MQLVTDGLLWNGRFVSTCGNYIDFLADDWVYNYDHLDQLLSADNAGDNTLDETFVYSPPPI